jgi:hypothetical protein
VGKAVSGLPGHRVVEVSFIGLDSVMPEPYPAPDDTSAPTTVATVSPPANTAGWHQGDVNLSLSATDDGVGVKHIQATVVAEDAAAKSTALIHPGDTLELPTLTAEGRYTITFSAVDAMGNAEAPQTIRVSMDLTDPQLTCEAAPTFLLGQPGSVAATVSDTGSGPVEPRVTGAVDTSSVGRADRRLTAEDVAGRTSELASAAVRSVRHACYGGAEEDPLEEVATGESGLQNLGDGYYQFNWKSARTYAGSCRTLEVDLGEGATRTAEFRFTG